jgi:hypothetical protein
LLNDLDHAGLVSDGRSGSRNGRSRNVGRSRRHCRLRDFPFTTVMGTIPSAENPQRFNAELAALVVQAGLTRGGAE